MLVRTWQHRPQGLSCTWILLDKRSLCLPWMCLHHRVLSCTCTGLRNVIGLQKPVLLLDLSPLQGPKLHMYMPGPQEPLSVLSVSL
jgi:hypothetical protein